jgi:hypothetical protein
MSGRWVQVGIAVGALGAVLTLIGLFPTLTGFDPTPGIGLLQIITILAGFCLIILGALIFVQSTFYPHVRHNLAQQIGIRLSLTGLLGAAAAGLADVLGYGSNVPTPTQRPILGPYQAIGLVGGFVIAAAGVLIFAMMGTPPHPRLPEDSGDPTQPSSSSTSSKPQ